MSSFKAVIVAKRCLSGADSLGQQSVFCLLRILRIMKIPKTRFEVFFCTYQDVQSVLGNLISFDVDES